MRRALLYLGLVVIGALIGSGADAWLRGNESSPSARPVDPFLQRCAALWNDASNAPARAIVDQEVITGATYVHVGNVPGFPDRCRVVIATPTGAGHVDRWDEGSPGDPFQEQCDPRSTCGDAPLSYETAWNAVINAGKLSP